MPWTADGMYSESNPGARTWGGIAGVLGAGLEGFMQADTQRRGEWREKQKEERANAQNQLALAMQMGDPGAFRGAYQKAFAPEGQYENNIAQAWRQTFGGPQQAPQMAQVPGGYGDYFKRMQEDRAAQIAEKQRSADMATRTMTLQEAQERRQAQEAIDTADYRKLDLQARRDAEQAAMRLALSQLGQKGREFEASMGLDRAKLGLTKEEMALKRSQSEWTNVGDALVNWRTGDVRYQKQPETTYVLDAQTQRIVPIAGKWGGTFNEPIIVKNPDGTYTTVGHGDAARIGGGGGKPAGSDAGLKAIAGMLGAGAPATPDLRPEPSHTPAQIPFTMPPTAGIPPQYRTIKTSELTDPATRSALAADEAFRKGRKPKAATKRKAVGGEKK